MNLPDLEEPWPIYILTKATEITRGSNIYVSKSPPGFIIQKDFASLNAESICGFTPKFVAICSSTSYPFWFPCIIKHPPIDILDILVNTLRNKDKKFPFIFV